MGAFLCLEKEKPSIHARLLSERLSGDVTISPPDHTE